MSKKKKQSEERIVAKSTYEIYVDNSSSFANTPEDAERKFRNATGRETICCYLYRHDYDTEGNLIETYMLA
jgi:hypothetical protein